MSVIWPRRKPGETVPSLLSHFSLDTPSKSSSIKNNSRQKARNIGERSRSVDRERDEKIALLTRDVSASYLVSFRLVRLISRHCFYSLYFSRRNKSVQKSGVAFKLQIVFSKREKKKERE